jgi:hypothetical protein
MSYIINKTNGETLLTLLDGTLDTSTGLNLVGKNYVGYGEMQQENFVWLLENFANDTPPTNPIAGQLWFDSATKLLNFYDGGRFRLVSTKTVGNTAPINNNVGDTWWDTANDQYKAWTGTDWSLVGPSYSKVDGKSGAIVETVYDTSGNKHTVVSLYVNNNRTAIVSYDQAFTPNVALTGFTTISPGINMNATNANNLLYGTAVNAQQLGNVVASSYARKDISETFASNVTVLGQIGIGPSVSGKVYASGNDIRFENSTGAITIGTAGVNSLTIDSVTGNVSVRGVPTTPLGVATKGFVDSTADQIRTEIEGNVTTLNSSIIANVNVINQTIDDLTGRIDNDEALIADVQATLTFKAPLDTPHLTGEPTAPTASVGTNNSRIASTEYVMNQDAVRKAYTDDSISANVTAINTDMTNRLALKANLASPHFTGTPTTPTAVIGANTAQVASTEFVSIATKRWDGSAKFVSTNYPDPNQGSVGDFWFRIES